MDLTLYTVVMSPQATISLLDVPGCGSVYTVERPWIKAEGHSFGVAGESCLPSGQYTLEKRFSPSFSPRYGRQLYYVTTDEVPARPSPNAPRWGCLFHRGNTADNVEGCIAPGVSRGHTDRPFVNNSRKALNNLHDWLDSNDGPHTLLIRRDTARRAG